MRFQSGGAVKKGALYVERSADSELPDALLAGEFCYLLAPRQIGKSSLRVRAAERLTYRGVRCATIDLQQIGSKEVIIDAWYFGLIEDVVHGLGLKCDPVEFWRSHELLTWPQRWSVFLREEVLKNIQEPTVIFVDEIDSVRALPFSADDFFATIRSAHEARAENENYERLTFCLMGVAAPSDLIQDVTRTPFNIGRSIHLQDFTWEESKQFLPNLAEMGGSPEKLLRAVYGWTDGHPYMMQKLCEGLSKQRGRAGTSEEERVDEVVRNLFLMRGRAADSNLRYAEDRFDNAYRAAAKSQMLQLYRKLLGGEAVPVEVSSPVQPELKLTGLVAEYQDGGKSYLKPRNRIFSSVYDLKWVNEKESNRLFHEALTNWQEATGRGESGDDYLLRGQALEEGLAWAESRDDISKDEREYLMAGLEFARGEAEAKTAARNRYAKRLTFLTTGLALMMLLTSGIAIFAFSQSSQVRKQAADLRASLNIIAEKNNEITRQAQDLRKKNDEITEQAQDLKEKNDEITEQARIVEEQNRELLLQRTIAEKRREEAEVQRRAAIAAEKKATAAASAAKADREAAVAEQKNSQRLLYASTINLAQQSYESGNLERAGELLNTPSLKELRGFEWGHLLRLVADYKTLTTGTQSPFRYVALSPAGRVIAVSGEYGVVSLWDAVSGSLLRDLSMEKGRVSALAFSPDGRTLAVGSNGSVKLWDITLSRQLDTLEIESEGVSALAFSPDGQTLAAGSSGASTVWLWKMSSRTRASLIDPDAKSILALAFSHDGKRLAAGSFDFVKLWDVETSAPVSTLLSNSTVSPKGSFRTGGLGTLAFSPDGRTLVAGSSGDGLIRVWLTDTTISREPTTRFAHAGVILSLAFSPDGQTLATGGSDKVVKLWSVEDYQEVESFRDFKSDVTTLSFWNKGGTLAAGTSDGTIKLWGLKSGRAPMRFEENSTRIGASGLAPSLSALAFSPDGQTLATGRTDGAVRLWEVVEGEPLKPLKLQPPQLDSLLISALAFSPDGRTLATGSTAGSVRLFSNTSSGWRRAEVGVIEGNGVRTLTFSPDGHMLAISRSDETVWLWDVDSRNSPQRISTLNGSFRALVFSPDGRTLAAGSSGDGTIWLYDLNSKQANKLSVVANPRVAQSLSLALSPNGQSLAAGSSDGTVRLFKKTDVGWVLDTEILRGDPDGILALAFSPDGQTLAAGGGAGAVTLWSTQSHRELVTLNGHTDGIVTLTFTRDGKSLLAAGLMGTVNLWRA